MRKVSIFSATLNLSIVYFAFATAMADPQVSPPTTAEKPAAVEPSPATALDRSTFAGILVAVILGATAFSLLTVRRSLLNSKWSLSDALSEDVEMTAQEQPAPVPNPPLKETRLVASTSRFIAMMGLIAILMMFIGFGMVILYDFARTGRPPTQESVTPLIYFLTAGLTLFAPYLVNKVAAAVS